VWTAGLPDARCGPRVQNNVHGVAVKRFRVPGPPLWMATAAAADSDIDRLEGGAVEVPVTAGMLPMASVATLGFTAFLLFRALFFTLSSTRN
jgi:hypothetical protein